ncbi:MAG: membrane protein insertion efficiency factor YidD [Alphaproteobacteria bacterium]
MTYIEKAIALMFKAMIMLYRCCISSVIPSRCRFLPTCSEYGLDAIKIHGPFRGFLLLWRRLRRCHPLGDHGFDPVPGRNSIEE